MTNRLVTLGIDLEAPAFASGSMVRGCASTLRSQSGYEEQARRLADTLMGKVKVGSKVSSGIADKSRSAVNRTFLSRFLFYVLLAVLQSMRTAYAAAQTVPPRAARVSVDGASTLAFRRQMILQRGVNLSGWLGGTGDLSPDHIAHQTTEADLLFIRASGLQYVRLCIDPVQLTRSGFGSPESQAALARIDHALDEVLQADLAVLITVFPKDDYKQQLATAAGERDFLELWRFLATHFAERNPERVFFDLLNEPEVRDPGQWDHLQADVVDAIRAVDTRHTLIACGSSYSGLYDLLRTKPVRDRNVIYTFHWYEPYPFTHQGATWGSADWRFFHDIPYPATPDDLRAQLAAVPDDTARYTLLEYALGGWNRAGIHERLQAARHWADEHSVPVICDEFGAYRETAPPASRVRYLHDVREDLESLHIGWAMWDYSGGLGMVTHAAAGSAPQPDTATIEALGLRTPAP